VTVRNLPIILRNPSTMANNRYRSRMIIKRMKYRLSLHSNDGKVSAVSQITRWVEAGLVPWNAMDGGALSPISMVEHACRPSIGKSEKEFVSALNDSSPAFSIPSAPRNRRGAGLMHRLQGAHDSLSIPASTCESFRQKRDRNRLTVVGK